MWVMVIGSFILVSLFLGYFAWCDITQGNSYKVISVGRIAESHDRDYLIELENNKGVLTTYRGSVSVWRNAETAKRVSTSMELMLSDIYTKHKWKGQK